MINRKLFIVFCLIITSFLQPVFAGSTQVEQIYNPNTIVVSYEEFNQLNVFAYSIQKNKLVNKLINTELPELLLLEPVDISEKNNKEKVSNLSTTQLMLLLHLAPELKNYLQPLLKLKPETQTKTAKATKALAEFKEFIKKLKSDSNFYGELQTHMNPTQPIALVAKDGSNGYEEIKTYVNHPRLADTKKATLPADNLLQVWIDFIDGAKQELYLNIYEFNIVEAAEAIIRAHKRGVHVNIGIDKKSFYTDAKSSDFEKKKLSDNQKIWDMFESVQDENFILRAVETDKINHQKIASRDADSKNAAVIISSGNLTYSCMHPKGDGHDLPKGVDLKEAIPNANHLIVMKGKFPAMIVKNELKKTIVEGLQGAQYPISGSYVFYGPKAEAKQPNPFFLIAFSPNGASGSINRDILAKLITTTQGPILAAQYAFSSDIVEESLLARIESEAKAGRKLQFQGIGDTNFAMQSYGSFMSLSGLRIDETSRMFSDDPDAPIRQHVNLKELAQIKKDIRIAPNQYRDYYTQIPNEKNKRKFSSILHHKLWIIVDSMITTPGTSFNTSKSAEDNHEQFTVSNDPSVFKILYNSVKWLISQSPRSVEEEAIKRNDYKVSKEYRLSAPKPTRACMGFY